MDLRKVTRGITPETVEAGYRHGIFPMAEMALGIVTWHRPSVRAIIPVEGFHIPRSLHRTMNRGGFDVSVDRAFDDVMAACAARDETWISDEFRRVYGELHRRGKAHSVEVWVKGALAGGLYGVHLGGAFFAESKFHRVTDMSKVALAHLAGRLRDRGFALLEVQYLTPHLAQFGTVEVSHREYMRRLETALRLSCGFT